MVLTAWAAVMIAGAVLLAVSLVVSLVTRFRQKELQGRPGMAILLALSDTVGITGIIEGIRGKELITNRELSAGEATERGVLGAVTLVGLILGARSALKGPPGGSIFRPIELPAGLFARMATGVSSVAAELASGLGRSARAVRDWLTGKTKEPIGCFVGGTPVLGDEGAVPVEQLVVGSRVVAQDPATGRLTTEVVVATSVRTVPQVLDVHTGGAVVTCSPEHPFWVEGAGGGRRATCCPATCSGRPTAGRRPSKQCGPGRAPAGRCTTSRSAGHTPTTSARRRSSCTTRPSRPTSYRGSVRSSVRWRLTRSGSRTPYGGPRRFRRTRLAVRRSSASPRASSNEARQLQGDANRASSLEDVADIEDWHASAKERLARLEKKLPASTEPTPTTPETHEFTAEGAMNELRQEGHWTTLNRDHPGRTWTGALAEKMPSDTPTQTKQKLVVTGVKSGEPPVSYDFSVVFDHETGRFTYIGRSGGKPKTL